MPTGEESTAETKSGFLSSDLFATIAVSAVYVGVLALVSAAFVF